MIRSKVLIAEAYRERGRRLEVQVMETRKTKLGANRPDTLTSMNNFSKVANEPKTQLPRRCHVQGSGSAVVLNQVLALAPRIMS